MTTEVLGLQIALARQPVILELDLRRLNGDLMQVKLRFPDEASALALKGFATIVRLKSTDVVDVWRCLEICYAAHVEWAEFRHGVLAQSAEVIRGLFARRDGAGMSALADELRLSREAADQRFARIRALIALILPAS